MRKKDLIFTMAAIIGILAFFAVFSQGQKMTNRTNGPSPSRSMKPKEQEDANLGGSGKTILEVTGTGLAKTQKFSTSRPWMVNWSYDCSARHAKGIFELGIFDSSTNRPIPNIKGLDEYNYQADGRLNNEFGGTYYILINTVCSWHITVKE